MAQTMTDMQHATLAYYPLKGNSKDFTSNGKNGTAINNVQYVPGIYGNAANFSSSGASIQLPIERFSRYADQYVLSAWVSLKNPTPVEGESSAFGIIAGRLSVSYQNSKLQFFFYYDSPTVADNKLIVLESKNILPSEIWINTLVMYDHEKRLFSFYFNGVLDSVVNVSDKVSKKDRPHLPVAFAIGGNYSGFSDHHTFNGAISDVIIMNSSMDTCCINCLAGVMNFTGIRGSKNRELRRSIANIHPDGELEAIGLFGFVAVIVVVAIVAIVVEEILIENIEDQPSAPPPPTELTPQKIADNITRIVGEPAGMGKQVTREDLGIPSYQRVHVDVGGLGPYVHSGTNTTSGFVGALNINDVKVNADSTPPNLPIPNLILVDKWNKNPKYPLGNRFADYVTMQSAPLFSNYVSEIARIVKKGGMIGLWIDKDSFKQQIDQLAEIFQCEPLPCTAENGNLDMDEFKGQYVFDKLLLVKNV